MSGRNTTWVYDCRGQKIPLRPDPEGVWRHQKSFRLNIASGDRLIKKHPRVAAVLAMREVQKLYIRPDSRKERVRAHLTQAGIAVVSTGFVYGLILSDFFGANNWIAILITLGVMVGLHLGSNWHAWRKADRRLVEITELIRAHPIHCAACWYPLESLFEVGVCVVCPECGAAWMLAFIDADKDTASS